MTTLFYLGSLLLINEKIDVKKLDLQLKIEETSAESESSK